MVRDRKKGSVGLKKKKNTVLQINLNIVHNFLNNHVH